MIGLSGDSLILKNNSIFKFCNSNTDRFIKNTNKQKNFVNEIIKPIPILDSGFQEGKFYIQMPFINSISSIDWLLTSNVDDLNEFSKKIVQYLIDIKNKSKIDNFDYDTWHDKIKSIKLSKDYDYVINYLLNMKFKNKFYYGDCHGDFTFSNMFISKEKSLNIDVFDFLTCFIESPLNDFVKFRQDSHHLFALNINQLKNNDKNKLIITMGFIDNLILNIINNDIILNEYYIPFQILNLLRILPYTSDIIIHNYIKQEVNYLYETNCNNTMCG